MPSFTFYATAEAAIVAGATPVFCDIDPDTFCVTAETVKAALTPRTKAIVPVHLFGNVAPVRRAARARACRCSRTRLRPPGRRSTASRPGALGRRRHVLASSRRRTCPASATAARSSPTTTTWRTRARRLRFHGSTDKKTFTEVGYNSRLDELQAAVLRVLLPELDGWNERRRAAAAAYERLGLGEHVRLPAAIDGAEHVYHLYVVRAEELSIGRGYYRVPVHRQPAIAQREPSCPAPRRPPAPTSRCRWAST